MHENEKLDIAAMRQHLQHVYWIGGGSGAGKSTVARQLAARYDLDHFSTDDAMPDHARRSTPRDSPFLAQFVAMDMDERWVNRSAREMLETFHWFRGEGFGLIVEDLLRRPMERGVIVEGFRLLPALVKPLLTALDHAVWLLPTTDFRQAVFDRRTSARTFLARVSNPDLALRNLLERDRMFTTRLREEASHLGLATLEVDITMTEEGLVRRVVELFKL